jgi:hypothetical protein
MRYTTSVSIVLLVSIATICGCGTSDSNQQFEFEYLRRGLYVDHRLMESSGILVVYRYDTIEKKSVPEKMRGDSLCVLVSLNWCYDCLSGCVSSRGESGLETPHLIWERYQSGNDTISVQPGVLDPSISLRGCVLACNHASGRFILLARGYYHSKDEDTVETIAQLLVFDSRKATLRIAGQMTVSGQDLLDGITFENVSFSSKGEYVFFQNRSYSLRYDVLTRQTDTVGYYERIPLVPLNRSGHLVVYDEGGTKFHLLDSNLHVISSFSAKREGRLTSCIQVNDKLFLFTRWWSGISGTITVVCALDFERKKVWEIARISSPIVQLVSARAI